LKLQADSLELPGALWPSSRVHGALRKVAARLKTAGGTPRSLIGNLSGEVEIGSARLTLPAWIWRFATRA
jgi:hypothetical protein